MTTGQTAFQGHKSWLQLKLWSWSEGIQRGLIEDIGQSPEWGTKASSVEIFSQQGIFGTLIFNGAAVDIATALRETGWTVWLLSRGNRLIFQIKLSYNCLTTLNLSECHPYAKTITTTMITSLCMDRCYSAAILVLSGLACTFVLMEKSNSHLIRFRRASSRVGVDGDIGMVRERRVDSGL